MLTYRFRLYPTPVQARTMEETLETCRRLYNAMLADRVENGTGFYERKRRLVEMKKDDHRIRSIHSQALQDVVLRLGKAYRAFFSGLSRYLRFRGSGRYISFTYPQSGFGLEGDRIFRCSACGVILDRDVNVARNILKTGLEQARVEVEPLLVQRRRISRFGR